MTSHDRPWMNAELPPVRRAELLLQAMDTDERVGQLVLFGAKSGGHAEACTLVRHGSVGTRLMAENAFAGNEEQRIDGLSLNQELQRIAIEESRLGIPLLFARDVIHGHRTVFPIPLAQAATWDPGLLAETCRVAAREAVADGVRWTYAPMIDVTRDPRWGRVAEGFGEDPWLTAEMGAAAVRGYQGTDGETPAGERILACAKHFAGYGAGLGGRDYHAVECSDHTLRNVHMLPFIACAEAGCASIMAGFHQVGGIPMTAHRRMLRGWLRDSQGFSGLVVSDWGAIAELEQHGCSSGADDSVRQAMAAGVDVDMCSGLYGMRLADLMRAGAVPEEDVDAAVRRVLIAKFFLGLFENPYVSSDAARCLRDPSHLDLARRQAVQAITLLRNRDRILPLAPKRQRIAVVGPLIDDGAALIGTWKGAGRVDETASIATAVRGAWPRANVGMARTPDDYGRVMQGADVVVLVVGEYPSRTGENQSVVDPGLPWGQDSIVDAVVAFGRPVVLVVISARPLVLPPSAEACTAIAYAWHGGNEAATALVSVLDGRHEPGGRLPISVPRHSGQIPVFYAEQRRGRPQVPCGLVGDCNPDPLFPFGSGEGYTRFVLSDVRIGDTRIAPDAATMVEAQLHNVGERPGATVVQLYVRDDIAFPARPERELRGFVRVHLEAGASARIRLPVGSRQLGAYDDDQGRWTVVPGRFSLGLGFDSRCALDLSLEVTAPCATDGDAGK